MDTTTIVFNAPLSPFVTTEKFSEITGIKKAQVDKMLHEGKLPIRAKTPGKPREKPLINMVALMREANDLAY